MHATNVYREPTVCPAPSKLGAPQSARDTNAYRHGDNDRPMTSLILARRSGCGSIWKPSLATFLLFREILGFILILRGPAVCSQTAAGRPTHSWLESAGVGRSVQFNKSQLFRVNAILYQGPVGALPSSKNLQ